MVVVLLYCYATTPYMRQNDRCTVVDLASAAFLSHTKNSGYNSSTDATNLRNTGKYYHNQNLAVIGLTDIRHKDQNGTNVPYTIVNKVIQYDNFSANGKITIKAELVSSEWCYSLIGNEDYKRPFGIDFFCRGKPYSGSPDADIENYSMQMGFQPNGDPTVNTIEIPESVVVNYESIWWDCCLVMDLPVDTQNDQVEYGGTIYHLLPSDDYYLATVKFTISCSDGTTQTYELHLAGTYKPNTTLPTNMTSIMSVTRLAAATSFDIAALYNSGDTVAVANYGYTTNSIKNGNKTGKVYLFLSSSSTGKTVAVNGAEKFTLRYSDPSGAVYSNVDSSSDSINFVAYLESERGHQYNTSDTRTIMYDGTDSFIKDNATAKTNYLVIESEETYDKQGDRFVRWYDSGTISIGIPQNNQTYNSTPDTLTGGMYTANIYVHVVTYM